MHLTDADLGAVLDPTGGGDRGSAARMHAATCAVCRDAVVSARGADEDVASLLRDLDHPVPEPDFASIRARAALAGRPSGPGSDEEAAMVGGSVSGAGLRLIGPRRSDGRRAGGTPVSRVAVTVRRGAVILALGAAAAAAAVPRSPARRLVERLLGPQRAAHSQPATPAPAPPAPIVAAPPIGSRGVAIIPTGRVELVFRAVQPVGEIDIRPTDGRRVAVTATGDGPTYSVGRDIVSIDNRGGSLLSYDVDLPGASDLPQVSIRIGDRVVFSRQGTTVVTSALRQPDGTYRLALTGADPSPP